MRKIYKQLLIAATMVICVSINNHAYGQSDSTVVINDDLFDLSLEDLLNMEITVASKKAEKASDAPGSITAYSSADIEKLGYYNLSDLANITAGYSAFKGIGETTFETRGEMQSGFDNNKHLVLIDGIPFNHVRANMAPAEDNLPLFFAKRVEFLKGPGSALYGTSAFSGVINILSKDLNENGVKAETKMSLGNYDFKRRVMSNLIARTDQGISKLSVGYFGKDATNEYLGNGTNPNANSVNRDNSSNFFMYASHKVTDGKLKGLGAGLIYSRKTGGLGEFWMFYQNQTFPINELTWEQVVPFIKYERVLTDKLSLNSYLKGNMSTESAYTGGYQQAISPAYGNLIGSNYSVRVLDREFLGELKYDVNEKLNIIGGTNVTSRYSAGDPNGFGYYWYAAPAGLTYQMAEASFFQRSSNYNIYSAYLQAQYHIDFLAGLNITAGARMDAGRVYDAQNGDVTNSYNQFSPRIAAVQKITEQFNFKLMYGRALRVPLVKEVSVNEETRASATGELAQFANQVPNVNAESIGSFEAAFTFNTDRVSAAVTGFRNQTVNALGRISIADLNNSGAYANLPGNIIASGIELELTVIPVKNLKVGGNFSTALAKDSADNQAANVPTAKLNGMVTYTFYQPLKTSIGLVGRYLHSYRSGVVHPFIENGLQAAESNTTFGGFTVFDINIVTDITSNVGLELQVRNLFDTDIRTPSGIVNSGMLNVPFPGRTLMATLSFKF